MVGRREFLAGLSAAFASACTAGADDLLATTTGPPSIPPSTALTTTTAKTLPTFAAPAIDLAADPFTLGVASGDPDAVSVVLWTRLMGDLGDEVPLVWELTTTDDAQFEAPIATGKIMATSGDAHSVHIVATGLAPGSEFVYRFRVDQYVSPVGRTKTMPQNSTTATVGVSSCQQRESGFWQAHKDISAANLDLMIWLGDYTYTDGSVLNLAEYRDLHAGYRSDPLLQAADASCPWLVGLDDNDVDNDYTANTRADAAQRQAAYQAWWEHQPTRLPKPSGPEMQFYRHVDIGTLARIVLFDVRQYSDLANNDLLGAQQRAWAEGIVEDKQAWTLFASPVLVSELSPGRPDLVPYAWPAFANDQAWLHDLMATVTSPMVISGDLHAGMSARIVNADGIRLAYELMAPSISSRMPADIAGLAQLLPILNENIEHLDPRQGWLKLELSSTNIKATFRTTEASIDDDPVVDGFKVTVDA